jgi:hypothetical protein
MRGSDVVLACINLVDTKSIMVGLAAFVEHAGKYQNHPCLTSDTETCLVGSTFRPKLQLNTFHGMQQTN